MTRKILYSPGYGAGWTSWEDHPEIVDLMLTYKPIIDFIEAGNCFLGDECDVQWLSEKEPDFSSLHPILRALAEICHKRFGMVPYFGGAHQLKVATVEGRVRINEYDGSESIEEEGGYSGWL